MKRWMKRFGIYRISPGLDVYCELRWRWTWWKWQALNRNNLGKSLLKIPASSKGQRVSEVVQTTSKRSLLYKNIFGFSVPSSSSPFTQCSVSLNSFSAKHVSRSFESIWYERTQCMHWRIFSTCSIWGIWAEYPKVSGSQNSSQVMPNSRRKNSWPSRNCRTNASPLQIKTGKRIQCKV